MLACQSQHVFFVFTEMLLQLCKEHGINKDGILEDFATQVKSHTCARPDVCHSSAYSSDKVGKCREVTEKTCSSIKQMMSASYLGLCSWTWSQGKHSYLLLATL
jgi:hypothetical protein